MDVAEKKEVYHVNVLLITPDFLFHHRHQLTWLGRNFGRGVNNLFNYCLVLSVGVVVGVL